MDLDDCFRKGLIKQTKVDKELIESLIEMSDIDESTVKSAKIDSKNIPTYVANAYDSLREALEALCISLGYKVLSHVCIGQLLVDKIEYFDLKEFDRLRWIRNSIKYYGKKIELEQGKEIINKTFLLKGKVIKLIRR